MLLLREQREELKYVCMVITFFFVVSHIQHIGCQPEKKLLHTVANPARGLLKQSMDQPGKIGNPAINININSSQLNSENGYFPVLVHA